MEGEVSNNIGIKNPPVDGPGRMHWRQLNSRLFFNICGLPLILKLVNTKHSMKNPIKTTAVLFFLCCTAMATFAQKVGGNTESSVYIKNGILFNGTDLSGGAGILHVKNTLQQGIGYSITRITKSGFLYSAGLDVGYEKYAAKIDFPFEEFDLIRPAQLHERYEMKATIPFLQLNLNIGYRFNAVKKITPEFRLGHILHIPLSYKRYGLYTSKESSVQGGEYYNFTSGGAYGKIDNSFVTEQITYIYIGVQTKPIMKGIQNCTIGLQFQRKFLFANNPMSYIVVDYFTLKQGQEVFNGTHTSIGLVLGVTF